MYPVLHVHEDEINSHQLQYYCSTATHYIALLRKCSNTMLVQQLDAMTIIRMNFDSGGASIHSLSSSGIRTFKK